MATIRYIVRGVEESVEFYTKKLGFQTVEQFGAMAILAKGDLTLWLAGPQASASRPMPDGSKPIPGGWNRLVIQMDDLAGTITEMKEAGVAFRNDIVAGPGGQQILVEEPSGNVIELFQPK